MRRIENARGFLGRLARDVRGNTIAIMAAAMMPLAGLIGGGVDMSRLYLTKTRLQQACDAGALAGRKAMAGGAWDAGDNAQATTMFASNFTAGQYGSGSLTKGFSESDGVVTGTATAIVPMTIMKVFGMRQRSITVNCTAKMEIPNTDVMFVLDVTGSMNCVAGDTTCTNNNNVPAAGSKILGLKSAVKCFYEALLKVNTSEVCGNDPTSTTYTQTAQIRIGFVPYSLDVNIGKLLPNSFLADQWTYQSRVPVLKPTPSTSTSAGHKSSWSSYTFFQSYNNVASSTACSYLVPGNNSGPTGSESAPTNQVSTAEGVLISWQTTTPYADYRYNYSYNSGSKVCTINRSQSTYQLTTYYDKFDSYTYKPVTYDVSGLKAGGSNWNSSINLSVGTEGAAQSVAWSGCIEERQTVKNSDGDPSDEWSPIPAAAYDMNIDMLPDAGTAGSQWGPMLPNAVWGRYANSGHGNVNTTDPVSTTSNLSRNDYSYCGTESKKLQTWYTPNAFETYVNSLHAEGNTYHDIGMIWGARLISPTGIFASENAHTSTGGPIQRHIIFMTDGDTMSYSTDYSSYGISWWDRRQTTYAPVDRSGTDSDTSKIINAHLAGLCTAIKNKNITLWVISYGGGINSDTENRLSTCATPGHYYSAADSAALVSRFRQIASEIAQLRLTS